jgi:hypothetical protein
MKYYKPTSGSVGYINQMGVLQNHSLHTPCTPILSNRVELRPYTGVKSAFANWGVKLKKKIWRAKTKRK